MAVSTSPTYPVAGQTVTLSLSAPSGNKTAFALSSSPPSSDLDVGIFSAVSDSLGVGLSAGDIIDNALEVQTFVPDAAGEYIIVGYDVLDIRGIASYEGDPSGERRFKTMGQETTTIHIGGYTYLPITTISSDNIRLRLQVNDGTIRDADFVDWTTDTARIASTASAVTAALTALVGQTIASVGTDLQTGVNDLRAKYEAHRIIVGAVHLAGADSINSVTLTASDSQESAISLLNEIHADLLGHLAAGTWHNVDDGLNVPLIGAASDIASATVLSADLRQRVYAPHRLQAAAPAVHVGADPGNALVAPSLLDTAITTYLDALALVNPTPPAGEPEGIVDADHLYGFKAD